MSNSEITSYIDRLYSLENEKQQAAEMIKELKAEAKSNGFDAEAIAEVVKRMMMKEERLKKLRAKEDAARLYAESKGQLRLF